MKFNHDFLTEMFRNMDSRRSMDYTDQSRVTSLLRDPEAARIGIMLKRKYCGNDVGLQENSYFAFGIPRVRRLNEEFYRNIDVSQADNAENESIAESASQQRNLRSTRDQSARYDDTAPPIGESRREVLNADRDGLPVPNQPAPPPPLPTHDVRVGGAHAQQNDDEDKNLLDYEKPAEPKKEAPQMRRSKKSSRKENPDYAAVPKRTDSRKEQGDNAVYGHVIRREIGQSRGGRREPMEWRPYSNGNLGDPNAIYAKSIGPQPFYFSGI